MKTTNSILLLGSIFLIILLPSCQNHEQDSQKQQSNKDSIVLGYLHSLAKEDSAFLTAPQEVDTADAKRCIRLYKRLMPTGIMWGNNPTAALTERVSFRGGGLADWLYDINQNGNYHDLRICLGIYDTAYVQKYISDSGEWPNLYGRITTFLWPFDNSGNELQKPNGTAQKPFNLGGVQP